MSNMTQQYHSGLNVSYSDSLVFYGLLLNFSNKLLILCLTLLLVILSGLLFSGIIWNDYFSSNTYKTLINMISSAISWTAVLGIPLIEVIDVMRYLVGPLPEPYCLFAIIFRNTIKTQILIFGDFYIATRCQLHQHSTSSFCTNILAPKNY